MLIAGLLSGDAFTQGTPLAPVPVLPNSVPWQSPPSLPGVSGAWMVGAQDKPGFYAFRVRIAAGARIAPHTHPDERSTTVLSGTLHVGFGGAFDESRLVTVPAGAIYVAPAGVPHYIWAKDGEAVYQESGIGPSATTMITQ